MSNESLSTSGATSNVPIAPPPRTGVVFVHGAGIWEKDYWKKIIDKINGCMSGVSAMQLAGAEGAWYSDVINSPQAQAMRVTLAPSQNAFMNALAWDSMQANIAATSPSQLLQKLVGSLNPLSALTTGLAIAVRPTETILDILARTLIGKPLNQLSGEIAEKILPGGMNVAATIRDVCLYLQNDPSFVRPIRQRLIDKLREAQQYDEIVLVSHSLGTVVAFDVLNEWAEGKPTISHWFTLGCPLVKILLLRQGTPNRLKNANVEHWYNVYDTSDIVAGPLGPKFTKSGYNIHDIFIDIGSDPIGSHDYFGNAPTLKLIADTVQATLVPVD
jgi:hypothetical protein